MDVQWTGWLVGVEAFARWMICFAGKRRDGGGFSVTFFFFILAETDRTASR